MDPVSSIIKLLTVTLDIWDSKEKTKYIDQKIKLEKEWYAEFNKNIDERSNLVMDTIYRELLILSNTVADAATKPGQLSS